MSRNPLHHKAGIVHHRACYMALVDGVEYKKRFSDIRDAKQALRRDKKVKGASVQIFYLPHYEAPAAVNSEL